MAVVIPGVIIILITILVVRRNKKKSKRLQSNIQNQNGAAAQANEEENVYHVPDEDDICRNSNIYAKAYSTIPDFNNLDVYEPAADVAHSKSFNMDETAAQRNDGDPNSLNIYEPAPYSSDEREGNIDAVYYSSVSKPRLSTGVLESSPPESASSEVYSSIMKENKLSGDTSQTTYDHLQFSALSSPKIDGVYAVVNKQHL